MQIDVTSHIGAVTRKVSRRSEAGTDLRLVTASRVYPTSADDLWNAVTSAERIPRWFLPITGDLRPGGRYQLQGNAGGEILACDAPHYLKITWEYGGQVSWVEIRIAKDGAGSRLTLEHTMTVDDHWKQFGAGATGVGWDMALLGLTQYIETGAPNVPEAGMAWMVSDNGKTYVRESSEAWGAAAIAAGEDADAAKAAVSRTTAAYTGS
jgi:uncharacterized protein YndB with AHSA1/START domain